ncbi:NAD(P)/FAD-dependent oxidoreductase [uncultured Chitinophaga sp.]|uniref:FAD-dependent oxidoreductase n=1 Tax=uncultured Chitinophaga sp. TaxID=339340 RepID=UPI0025DC4A37|nr:NAD(P)/FAD-dependent oxidoreductase [uncultured Chitinophaga sp.]
MKPIHEKKIAIVGGGPGGLTLARLLQMKGAEVKVYERDINKDVRVQGATLDLHEDSGLKALQEAGLMDAFKANYRPGADKTRVVDKHGAILLDEEVEAGELFRPEIDRGPLRKILLESLAEGTVVWDSHFKQLVQEDDRWKLEFHSGSAALADIVIAADGANSKLRPYITPIKPFFAGMTIVEGAVYDSANNAPAIHTLLAGGKIFALGDAKSLIVSSKGDGSLVFYTGCKTTENWVKESGINFSDREQVRNWFKQEFAGWSNIWQELFDKAEPNFIPRPQYCMPTDQHWPSLPNLTLLGDAAHLMPPYAGEGVNMAMLDALELAKALTGNNFHDAAAAIAVYELQMLSRASATAQMTLIQTESMHCNEGLENLLAMFSGVRPQE